MRISTQIIVGAMLLLCACHKNNDPQPQPPTPTELLTGKKWQLQASTIAAAGQPTVDLYALTPAYIKDNFQQFDSPDTFTYDEGPTRYDTSTPQTQKGTWVFGSNNTQLNITLAGRTTKYSVDELTATSLKLHSDQAQANGSTSTLSNSYTIIP